ncbi:hypothetical protein GGR54DRAFT_639233 [Hypoxylon sp. NC1633]|nr:hypothetical protein GGR54DRAFT_639233 [Hypoxylon sp. NC1633]
MCDFTKNYYIYTSCLDPGAHFFRTQANAHYVDDVTGAIITDFPHNHEAEAWVALDFISLLSPTTICQSDSLALFQQPFQTS